VRESLELGVDLLKLSGPAADSLFQFLVMPSDLVVELGLPQGNRQLIGHLA
jgi:hypothetical protein